jgi:hypothetical protein
MYIELVFTENDSFDPKWLETHFLSWLIWFDLYWPSELVFYVTNKVNPRKIYFWILNFFLIFLDFS